MGKLLTCVVAIATLLTGCNSGIGILKPHRIDIQQGNAVEAAQADRVREGMTRRQVRFLLGTPLIADAFRDDRWEYVYFFKPGRGPEERRRLSVFFADDTVIRVVREGLPEPTIVTEQPASETPSATPVAEAVAAVQPTATESAAEPTPIETPSETTAAAIASDLRPPGDAAEPAVQPPSAAPEQDAPDCVLPAFVDTATRDESYDAGSQTPAAATSASVEEECVLRAFPDPQ